MQNKSVVLSLLKKHAKAEIIDLARHVKVNALDLIKHLQCYGIRKAILDTLKPREVELLKEYIVLKSKVGVKLKKSKKKVKKAFQYKKQKRKNTKSIEGYSLQFSSAYSQSRRFSGKLIYSG